MKLISINTWGGKTFQSLMDFIKENSRETDIFCFQEVFNTTSNLTEEAGFRLNLFNEITRVLNNHQGYIVPTLDNYLTGAFQPNFTNYQLSSGLAIFVKRNLQIEKTGDFFVYRTRGSFDPKDLNSLPRNIQYINFAIGGKKYTICNLHGIWLKEGKKDAPARLEQSRKINEFLESQTGEKILVGDFNLDINTESIKMLETSLINLIKKYNIQTTRSKFFPGDDKFADYTFVSPDVNVTSFQVPAVEVSDHLPMILEFS